MAWMQGGVWEYVGWAQALLESKHIFTLLLKTSTGHGSGNTLKGDDREKEKQTNIGIVTHHYPIITGKPGIPMY